MRVEPAYGNESDASLGELVRTLAQEGSALAKAELKLAQAKGKVRARAAAIAIALLALAGLFGLICLISAMIALGIWLADLTDSAALGAFLVALLNLGIAGAALLIAKSRLQDTKEGDTAEGPAR